MSSSYTPAALNPYRLSDDEYNIIYEKYHRLIHKEADLITKKLPFPDIKEDVEQELFLSLMYCGERYKLQKFVSSAIEFFCSNPDLIPHKHTSKVWLASWYWIFRAKLGPKHGFKCGLHDQHLAEALEDVNAPIDTRYETLDSIKKWAIDFCENETIPKMQRQEFTFFLKSIEKGDYSATETMRIKIHDIVPKITNVPVKPSRNKPLDVDEFFPPYCKQFLRNAGNKIKDVLMKKQKIDIGSVDIDSFASAIPDCRPTRTNLGWNNQLEQIKKEILKTDDSMLMQTYDFIEKNQDSGIIHRGSINRKMISRELKISSRDIEQKLRKMRKIIEKTGGADNPFDEDYKMDYKFDEMFEGQE